MSFGKNKSFRRSDLGLKKELEELTRRSQKEYATLSVQDKTQLLENVSQKPFVSQGRPHKTKARELKTSVSKQGILKEEKYEKDTFEVPPPSPSVDLEPEMLKGDTQVKNTSEGAEIGGNSQNVNKTRTSVVASIRANVDLSVVMHGRGIVDGDRTSKASTAHSTAGRAKSSNHGSAINEVEQEAQGLAKKPVIISSQGTSVQVQLNRRPTPPQEKWISASRGSATSAKSSKSHGYPASQPQSPDLASQKDFGVDNEEKGELFLSADDEAELANTSTRTKSAKSCHSESEYDKIHSEIQELTLKLSSGLNIADILRSKEKEEEELEQKVLGSESQRQFPEGNLTRIQTDEIGTNDFTLKGASPVLSPRLTASSTQIKEVGERDQDTQVSSNIPTEQDKPQRKKEEMSKLADESRGEIGQIYSSVSPRQRTEASYGSPLQANSSLLMTDGEALQALETPAVVTAKDIINITGSSARLVTRILPTNQDWKEKNIQKETTFLASWEPLEQGAVKKIASLTYPNIHHFCKMPPAVELPPHLCQVSRDTHTPDRLHHARQRLADKKMDQIQLHAQDSEESKQSDEGKKIKEEIEGLDENVKEKNEKNAEGRKLSQIAQKILDQAETGDTIQTFDRLKKASDQLFADEEVECLIIAGKKIELRDNSSRLYWTPAPPKMHLAPSAIRAHLFPEYHGAALLKENLTAEHMTLTVPESDGDDEPDDELDPEVRKTRDRVLLRAHGSMTDMSKLLNEKRPEFDSEDEDKEEDEELDISDIEREGDTPTRFESVLDKRRHKSKRKGKDQHVGKAGEQEDEKPSIRRAMSQPFLFIEKNSLLLSSGYDISMQELSYQQDKLAAIKAAMAAEEEAKKLSEEQEGDIEAYKGTSSPTSEMKSMVTASTLNQALHRRNIDRDGDDTETFQGTGTETASAVTGITKIVGLTKILKMKPLRRKIKRKIDPQRRVKQIQDFLNEPPRFISRSHSVQCLRELREPSKEKVEKQFPDRLCPGKSKSLTDLVDFQQLLTECSESSRKTEEEIYDWVREQYWYVWFDELYPPSEAPPDLRYDLLSSVSPRPGRPKSKASSVVDNAILEDIQVIEPEISADNMDLYQALETEVTRLDSLIEETEKQETLAIHLCRRGAVYRKLGQLKNSWEDLNRAIDLEPMLLDAYWHRHLLQLLQNNRKAALEDLSFIIKHNSKSARAFRSRAELYRTEDDATMAIVNYSQAIKLSPDDADTYYQRAAMFEKRGDMILALEDYRIAFKLMPSKTDAICNIGIYHFENGNWCATIGDFTEMLEQDPKCSKAYTYRARAFAKLSKFEEALCDLSAAVHYDPNNAVAFYHRGCLLRKIHSRQALQDFSVSLLLDNSLDNVKAHLHRGILYTDLKRWDDAIPDFQAALRLDRSLACAHVNIGLIFITRYGDYHKAIRRYAAAILVNPTYIRAYICRAEAYHKLKMLQEAVLDYTRAIHLRPDISDYRMARGKLLLEQNKLDLASFHVRQAAELNQGLGASATQQAVVQSFLKNFDQAIETLERATRVKPISPLFILLGKTHMKSKKFREAIVAFDRAIKIMTPWDPRVEMTVAAAPVYFLIGMCHGELGNNLAAQDAFNNAIKVNPQYAEAFYQRGLTKMKLKHTKGIHDFNRALAINPSLFQAFLSRAAYYGMKGRYSKGIMSCNEAIKLQPQSVRAYLYRGALKYHIKAYSLAVKDLTEAVAIDCSCSLAYFNRAVCYHEMKYFQKALMDYGTVMLLESKPNLKVLQNRGLLYLQVDDVENALQDFIAAAKVSENDQRIRHALGLCYHRLNRLEKAVTCYNDALRIDPFFVEAYNGRGNALMDYGHQEGNLYGRRDYLKALHISPVCLSARVNLAYNLQVDGCFQAAWNQFSAAISIDSECQAALEGRAIINLQMRNTFGAFVDMNAALKISQTAELLTNRGVVHQFMGDYVNAVRDYQAAIKMDPSYALAYYNAANVYFRQRMFQQALVYYDKALSWTPNDESAILNRAIAKVMMKDLKGALHDFNKAATLNPYAAHVYFNRANLFASLRKYKEAEEDYTRALSLNPGDALVYKRRADVLGKLSKMEAAILDYKKAIIIQTRRRPLHPGSN